LALTEKPQKAPKKIKKTNTLIAFAPAIMV
jgi:hypothetical protein